jgi:hypothetical protein
MLVAVAFHTRGKSGIFLTVPAPTAPEFISAQAQGETEVLLTWTDNSSDETGFEIYRSEDDVTYTLIDTTAPNVETYTDTTASSNTLYYYKIRASVGGALQGPMPARTFLPGPLYVSFKVKFAADEVAAFSGEYGTQIMLWYDVAAGGQCTLQYRWDLAQWLYVVGGSAVLVDAAVVADTYYYWDFKVDYSSVPGQTTMSARLDGVDQDDAVFTSPLCPTRLVLGCLSNLGGSLLQNRTFDDVTFGNSDWRSTEYVDANFASTIVPPFDDTEGLGTTEIVSGAMHTTATPPAQAIATFEVPPA